MYSWGPVPDDAIKQHEEKMKKIVEVTKERKADLAKKRLEEKTEAATTALAATTISESSDGNETTGQKNNNTEEEDEKSFESLYADLMFAIKGE